MNQSAAAGIRLPGQTPDEKVILVLHRHWIIFFLHAILFVVMLFVPAIVMGILWNVVGPLFADRSPGSALLVLGLSLYYLFIGLQGFHSWLEYQLDYWVVTNKRIANIDQRGAFSRVVSEVHIDRVQDVTVEVHGLLATFFHFGDIRIQTAAETPRFHFDDVPNPYGIGREIMRLHELAVKQTAQPVVVVPPSQATPPPAGL